MRTKAGLWMVAVALGLAAAAQGQERAGVSLVTAQPVSAASLTATGRVLPVVSARLSPRVAGQLTAFGPGEGGKGLDVGMNVKKGDVVFRIDETTHVNAVAAATAALESSKAALANLTAPTRPEKIEQYRQAVAELRVKIEEAERDEQRYRRLVEEDKTVPAKRLEESRTQLAVFRAMERAAAARLEEAVNGPTATEIALAKAKVAETQVLLRVAEDDLRDCVVRAPFDGQVTARFKSPGDYIATMPLTEVIEVTSLDQLEVEFRIPEAYFGRVQAGQTALAVSATGLKKPLALKVTRVIGRIDPAKGTFPCRATVTAEQRNGLVPGMFVTVGVTLASAEDEVVVPQRALVKEGEEAFVFVAADGKMARRKVQVGDWLTEGVVIKSGLKGGEQVVVGPAEALKEGAAVPGELRK